MLRTSETEYHDESDSQVKRQSAARIEDVEARNVPDGRSELIINLLRGQIRIWLHLSKPLCLRIAPDLIKANHAAPVLAELKESLQQSTHTLRTVAVHRHLPPDLIVVSNEPNLDAAVPDWLRRAGHWLGLRTDEWVQRHMARYLGRSAQELRLACFSHPDGVTLRITMTRIPTLGAPGVIPWGNCVGREVGPGGSAATPEFELVLRGGYARRRRRD
jgi:hypothetical protein